MKKIVYIMVCVAALMLALAACGANEAQVAASQTQTEQQKESPAPAETAPTPAETPEQAQQPEPEQTAGTVFEQYEAALDKQGISFEKVQMAAEIVGAAEGAKYKIDGGAVELYLFDTESEAYKTAAEKQALTMQGFGDFPATVEKGMALVVSDLESEPYLEIFHSLTVTE